MKRRQTFNLVRTAMLLLVMLCSLGAWAEKKIVVFSDPHVMSEDLLVSEGSAWTNYLAGQRKMVDHSKQLFDDMIDELKSKKPDLVLITGDLTKDGEELSHTYVITKLNGLLDQGIKVLVIPGNHDRGENENAVYYNGDGTSSATVASNAWFADFYANFGYGNGSERESTTLTYACEPLEGLVVIGIDSGTDGTVSQTTLEWIATKAAAAQAKGKRVIAMMHHPLIPHFTGADTFVESAVVANYETVRNALADAGINVVFTGHFHTSDIAKDWNEDRSKEIYDVNTGSLISYPCDYREVTFSDNFLEMSITTGHISTSLSGVDDFTNYAKNRLHTAVQNAIAAKGGAYDMIAETAADAFIIHAEGNEQNNDESDGIISYLEYLADFAVYLNKLTSGEADAMKAMINSMLQDKSNYGTNRMNVTNDLKLKSFSMCTAIVPNPIYNSGEYHGYFYDGSWNDNHGGIEVYDGTTLLTYGTDYKYSIMESLDNGSCENLGEHCRVYLDGMGAYAGTLYKDVVIEPNTVTNASWGTLTWSLDGDGKFTISGTGDMNTASDYTKYPWYAYSSNIKSISIGEGITSVAANAFAGNGNVNPYSSVTSVTLPSTLETIGDYAFAYNGLTSINIPASVTSIGDGAFNQCTSLETITLNGGLTIGGAAFPTTTNTNVTVTIANDLCLYNGTEGLSGDVTDMSKLNDKTLQVAIPYIDANGNTAYCTNFTEINTSNMPTTLSSGWYVVTENVEYGQTINGESQSPGDINIILCDGAKMSITVSGDNIIINPKNDQSLNIYGQRDGTGRFTGTSQFEGIVFYNNITINGGIITVTAKDEAISSFNGNVTINGGQVEANGGIYASNGTITLGWHKATDFIKASSYSGTVIVKDGQAFTYGGNYFYGTITDKSAIAGQTLKLVVPYTVADGNTAYCTDFTVLDNTMTTLSSGWYVVNSDVTFSGDLSTNASDEVHIILCDGATLTANNITPIGYYGDYLRIYAQSQGTGTANISGEIMGSCSLNIYGGNISATGTIYCAQSGLGIFGGNVTAAVINGHEGLNLTGGTITAGSLTADEGSIKLGGATVKANNYIATNGVTITNSKTYYDGEGHSYTAGNLSADQISAIAGKKLRTYNYCTVSYVKADGTEGSADAIPLTGGGATTLAGGWYVAQGEVNYTGGVELDGDVNLILADNAVVNIGTSSKRISDYNCIWGGINSLTIYGQSTEGDNVGQLKAYNSSDNHKAVYVKNYTQYGGKVTIDDIKKYALYFDDGDLTLVRGTLNVTAHNDNHAICLIYDHTANVSGGTLNATVTGNNYIAIEGNLTITGGTVNATGGYAGIFGNTTISGGTLNATSNEYAIKGDLNMTGGNVTIDGIIQGNATLGWTNATDFIKASSYGGTVTIVDGKCLYNGSEMLSGTITDMSKLNGKKLRTYDYRTVSYVKADGTEGTADAIPLDGTETEIGLNNQTMWYFVGSDISYSSSIKCYGYMNIILADGKSMTVNSIDKGIYGSGTLYIYGQQAQTGILNTTGTGYGIHMNYQVYIHGGTINATGNVNGIDAYNQIFITGGKVTATGNTSGIFCRKGNIILGLRNNTDYITANSYGFEHDNGTVNIADGKSLYNGTEEISGTITDMSKLNGKALTPSNNFSVTANEDPAHDDEYWSTFYHPVAGYQVPAGTSAYIGTVGSNSVTLTEITDGIIPANTAVVLKATSGNFNLTRTADTSTSYATTNDLKGGSTVETGKVPYTLAAKSGVVAFYKFTGAALNPNKAHLEIAPSSTRKFYGFDIEEDATSLSEELRVKSDESDNAIYNLAGQKLSKPQKGINIVNGRKVLF